MEDKKEILEGMESFGPLSSGGKPVDRNFFMDIEKRRKKNLSHFRDLQQQEEQSLQQYLKNLSANSESIVSDTWLFTDDSELDPSTEQRGNELLMHQWNKKDIVRMSSHKIKNIERKITAKARKEILDLTKKEQFSSNTTLQSAFETSRWRYSSLSSKQEEFKNEAKKLRDMQREGASKQEIEEQQKIVKKIKLNTDELKEKDYHNRLIQIKRKEDIKKAKEGDFASLRRLQELNEEEGGVFKTKEEKQHEDKLLKMKEMWDKKNQIPVLKPKNLDLSKYPQEASSFKFENTEEKQNQFLFTTSQQTNQEQSNMNSVLDSMREEKANAQSQLKSLTTTNAQKANASLQSINRLQTQVKDQEMAMISNSKGAQSSVGSASSPSQPIRMKTKKEEFNPKVGYDPLTEMASSYKEPPKWRTNMA